MGRGIGLVLALSAVMAGKAQAQNSIGVSAVIVEPMEAGPVQVDVRPEAGRWSVGDRSGADTPGSRLLRQTYVRTAKQVQRTNTAGRGERDGSGEIVPGGTVGGRLQPGAPVLIEPAEHLTVTRVIAANS